MTTLIIKDSFRSAFSRPIFLILLVITLLMAPASAFASGDDSTADDSSLAADQTEPTDQSGGSEESTSTEQFESPTAYEQDATFDSDNIVTDYSAETSTLETPSPLDEQLAPAEVIASVDTETADTDTGLNGTSDTGGSDPTGGQDFAALETNLTTADDYPAVEAKTTTLYFQVEEVSMSPLLNPGAIVEIASETYADGDMVVAQKSDGTYIVKMLSGDQLVSLGAGESYNAADVTILGAAAPSLLTAEDLELSGLSWSTVLAKTAIAPTGSGNLGSPYLITSLENLYWITADPTRWAAYYLQTDNIDASATSGWNSGSGWEPIGTLTNPFTGTYDGNDKTIGNLYIKREDIDDENIGLFGYTSGTALLKNIKLENVDVTSKTYVGGLVGYNGGIISNSSASGTVTGDAYVGGLVGYNYSGTINNSCSAVNVTGDTDTNRIGGLAGANSSHSTINNSYATGNVTGGNNSDYIGGLVGRNNGTIENSSATGNVTCGNLSYYIGGLVGENSGTISMSYSTGTVIGYRYVGGLVGRNNGTIENSSATGNVTCGNLHYYIGGLVGENSGTISMSYSTGTVIGYRDVGGLIGRNYGNGTIENSYATGTVTGTNDSKHVGGLIGRNYGTIKNSYATGTVFVTGVSVGGLVGDNYSGTIKNSYAAGAVTGHSNVGGLVGQNPGSISNSYAAGAVTGTNNVGGLVGFNSPGTISNSYWNTDVNGSLAGIGYGSGDVTGKTTAELQTLAFHQTTLGWNIAGQDGSYPVLGWQVNWKDNIWYMGTPPLDDGSGGGDFGSYDFDFASELLTQLSTGLTTLTGQSNAVVTPGIIAYGSWNDFYQASAAYQVALEYLESNRAALSPVELALLEVELAIARAAILAMEARLLSAEGLPYNMADLEAAYAAAVATVNAHQSFLSADQLAAANQLLAAIAGVIAALQ